MTSEIGISVVIPTKNEGEVLVECLSSIFNQSKKPSEVIIVDGRSTDDTIEQAKKFDVKVIIEEEPTSLPNARNLGAKSAKGPIVFIMDADISLDKNCLENALRYFEDQKVIAVVPSEHNVAHTRLEKIQMDWIHGFSNPMRPGVGISVFAEFIRKSVFDQLSFDPTLGYGEDEDFQRRLKTIFGSSKIIRASDCFISVHYCHTLKELKAQFGWYGRTFKTYISKKLYLKPILNLGSLLAPTILIILGVLSFLFIPVLPFFIVLALLIIARNLIVCYRSKSWAFFEFLGFEFLRSFFFIRGLLQGISSKKRGR